MILPNKPFDVEKPDPATYSKDLFSPGKVDIQNGSSWGILPGYDENARYESLNYEGSLGFESPVSRRQFPWSKFDRFYSIDLERENPSGRHYIFICRPDLYLIKEGSATNGNTIELSEESRVNRDDYFMYLAKMHPEIIASLTGDFGGFVSALSNTSSAAASASGYGNSRTTDGTKIASSGMSLTIHTFVPYLTTRIESIQLPDYQIQTGEIVQPYTHYRIPYTKSALESSTGGEFTIEFREDRYYSIHKLFYAWIYYQNGVMRNIFKPKKKYIMYNSLDYPTSIYDFLVDETGENVIYWAKYTGCVPTSVPMSNLSYNRGSDPGNLKVSIPFNYFYCEHMSMSILRDFQYNSLGYIAMKSLASRNTNPTQFHPCELSDTVPIYNADRRIGETYVGRPVLILTSSRGKDSTNVDPSAVAIKLRWLP